MKRPEKKNNDDAVNWEAWMPIETPCKNCDFIVYGREKGASSSFGLFDRAIMRGCKLSRDGFGDVTPIGIFRDPKKECSKFEKRETAK